mmetsp:Transcript_11442/g.13124  ORF Transcript_11442/g.13124 Transcript_11442/m.13124 type:complete len:394 (-) Transcript_11442:44-1225(-)
MIFTFFPSFTSTRPGASSVPASIFPSITVSAPAAMALEMSPASLMPPSAMQGTPCRWATSAHSITAESCGTPLPATRRVMQIEPGPTPILSPSAPAAIKSAAPSPVAIFPAITSTWRQTGSALSSFNISMQIAEWPCAISITSTSQPVWTRARARCRSPFLTPTAAPTKRRPFVSKLATWLSVSFTISDSVTSPTRSPSVPTMGMFDVRCLRISSRASSRERLRFLLHTRRSIGVIRVPTKALSSAKTRSFLVMMPRSFRVESSMTMRLRTPFFRPGHERPATASFFVDVGAIVRGSSIMRDWARFTLRTISHCSSTEQKRCRMPIPPSRAIAIAVACSHTVSMLLATIGMLSVTLRDSFVLVDTSFRERTSERRGTRSTSSYVKPNRNFFST